MARYSSDSDSDRSSKHRRKHYRRSRSSSSDSSDSSSHRKRSSKYSKSRHRSRRSRSRSRDNQRSFKSYRSSPGSSKDKDRPRYKPRRSKSRSPDRIKKKTRSVSREKSTSRSSSSQSYIKITTEKPNVIVKDEFSIEPRIKESILDEINADKFVPKTFTSSAQSKNSKKENKNIVIDITNDTIQVPSVPNLSVMAESIFHSSIALDQEARFDKWVKKLYNLRQKAMSDLLSNST